MVRIRGQKLVQNRPHDLLGLPFSGFSGRGLLYIRFTFVLGGFVHLPYRDQTNPKQVLQQLP